jgi:hypothetical protein
MPDCERCDCDELDCLLNCPNCICPPPGGGGLAHFLPEYSGGPFQSQHGVFYTWETKQQHPFRVLKVNQNGTVDIRMEYSNGQGEVYKPGMPYAKSQDDVDVYLYRRNEHWLPILHRHLAQFAEQWKREYGDIIPLGGIRYDRFFVPRMEGFDCPATILKTDGVHADVRLSYASGNGWSNHRNVPVFISDDEVDQFIKLRRSYCEMIAPYQGLAIAEWAKYKGESY